jgi:hypothetical protein
MKASTATVHLAALVAAFFMAGSGGVFCLFETPSI